MKLRSSRTMIVFTIAVFLSLIQSSQQTNYSCDTSATCGCSTSSATVSRIVGGESADIQSWSWAVYMSIADTYLCGGSILSSSWIITAAHCVEGFTASQITVYAGSSIRGSNAQSRQASLLIKHPNYDTNTFVNDIALIQLNPPLDFAEFNLKPICLKFPSADASATSEWPPASTTVSDLFYDFLYIEKSLVQVVAVGWGRTTEGGQTASSLRQVTLRTVDRSSSTCTRFVTNWQVQLCAGVDGGGKGNLSPNFFSLQRSVSSYRYMSRWFWWPIDDVYL